MALAAMAVASIAPAENVAAAMAPRTRRNALAIAPTGAAGFGRPGADVAIAQAAFDERADLRGRVLIHAARAAHGGCAVHSLEFGA
jgi:hypothetical protein